LPGAAVNATHATFEDAEESLNRIRSRIAIASKLLDEVPAKYNGGYFWFWEQVTAGGAITGFTACVSKAAEAHAGAKLEMCG
jgi:hypothetical protein